MQRILGFAPRTFMNADGGAGAASGSAPATAAAPAPTTPPPAAPAPTPPPGEEWRAMPPEAFNKRLADERGAGTRATLKELGFASLDEARARIAKATEIEQAQMTAQQKVEAQLKDLQPKAQRAEALEGSLKRYLEAEEKAIPEAKRGLLDLAPPVEQPEARLDWISRAKERGLFKVDAAPPVEEKKTEARPPNPATTGNPAGPPAVSPTAPKNKFEEWQAMRDAGHTHHASRFYQTNRTEIEKHRPK